MGRRYVKNYIFINKNLYRSMKRCDKKTWKSIFVYNWSGCYWQIQKYLLDDDIDVEYVLKNIGAKYDVVSTSIYKYYVISKLEG